MTQVVGRVVTCRLVLRPLAADDVELLARLNSNPEVMRFISGRPSTLPETQDELVEALGCRWLVFHRESGEFAGWVGAIPSDSDPSVYDLGWRFREQVWGNGFATEATRALIDALFTSGASRVTAQTMAINHRSRRVMERCGLRYSRTFSFDGEDPLPGTEKGEVEYELTRQQWGRRPPP